MTYVLVFIGGGLGSICRYGLVLLLHPWHARFPFATLAANALACGVLGFVVASYFSGNISEQRRLLLATGFCGGFSTFSTFTIESWQLWENGQATAAVANVALNLTVCLVCLLLGLKLGS